MSLFLLTAYKVFEILFLFVRIPCLDKVICSNLRKCVTLIF